MTLLIVFGSTFAYCFIGLYTTRRLVWYFNKGKRNVYDDETVVGASLLAFFLMPVAISMVIMYMYNSDNGIALAPRSVRREEDRKKKQARIKELERELGYR